MAYDFTRRHFFFGSLLAGAIPSGGYGSTASLLRLGYKSPNEKLNIASIGAGESIDTETTRKPIIGFVFSNKGLMYNLALEGSKITRLSK